MMVEESTLPQGWSYTLLEKIASWGSGGTPSRNVERYFQGTIPWVKTGELESKYIRETEEHISEEALNNSSAKIFPKGSVGIAMYGATIGKLSIWGIDASTNQACAVGIPSDAINNEFLYYYLLSERQNLIKAGKGGAQPNLSQGIIKEWPINLPPLPEQHRIVAKIEELFSELDKGIENLKTARAQLKVYRQALLKHAFEGKLTAQWRAENQGKLETADALLKRIQHERAQRYQQQLADWENKSPSVPLLQSGKTSKTATPPLVPHFEKAPCPIPHFEKGGLGGIYGSAAGLSKPKAPKPLPPLTAEELAELPELPEGWGWFAMGEICQESILGKMLDKEKNKGELKPYLRNINVRWGKFDLDDLLEMRFEESEYVRFGLVDGDLVICEGGEPGRCAVWRKELGQDMQIQKALHRVRFTNSVNSFFVQMYFELCASNRRLEKMFTGTTIKHLTGEKLTRMAIPICAIDEQVQILLALESKFSEADQLDQTITTSLQQAEALRQSILKKAFSGQLVPQDPHDEPASALLARIKAERAEVVAKPRKNISSKLVNAD